MSRVLVEVCCGSAEEAVDAASAGADRLEVCGGFEVGGVTPTPGTVQAAVETGVPVVVMLRSHAGWMVPSGTERTAMLRDCEWIGKSGATEVIAGAMDESGSFDLRFLDKVRDACGLPVVAHRYLDDDPDFWKRLDELVGMNFRRILTAGGAESAWEGRSRIREIVSRFGDQMEVLPGGGIGIRNVVDLVRETGVRSVHFSARISFKGGYCGYGLSEPDGGKVAGILGALESAGMR